MSKCTRLLLVPFLLFQALGALRADVIVLVDPSDTSNVTFTATGAFSSLADSSTNTGIGLTLDGILASNFMASVAMSGNLTPSAADEFTATINGFLGVDQTDLNLYRDGGPFNDMTFATDTAALTGQGAADLTGAPFRPVGSVGNIFVGDGVTGSGSVIGQYRVVPEPASIPVLGFASIVASLSLRRRQKRPFVETA